MNEASGDKLREVRQVAEPAALAAAEPSEDDIKAKVFAEMMNGAGKGPSVALDRLEKRVLKIARFGFEVDGSFIEGGGGNKLVKIQDVLAAIRAEREQG